MSEQKPLRGWQPIETAPKDGTHILVGYADGGAAQTPTVAWWESQKYNRKPVPYWASERGYLFGTLWDRAHQPTHWQPLPAPPAQHAAHEFVEGAEHGSKCPAGEHCHFNVGKTMVYVPCLRTRAQHAAEEPSR